LWFLQFDLDFRRNATLRMADFSCLRHRVSQLFAEIRFSPLPFPSVNVLNLALLDLLHENITLHRCEAFLRWFHLVQVAREDSQFRSADPGILAFSANAPFLNAPFLNAPLKPSLRSWTGCPSGATETTATDEQSYET
jgi:hypothetical protein